MDEPEETINKAFTIHRRHLLFLERVNENHSLALRTVLDSNIRNERSNHLKENLTIICFGLLFFMFAFLIEKPAVIYLSTCIGVVLLIYGLIGGVMNALRRTR